MMDRHSTLEYFMNNRPQDRLAQRYAATGTESTPSEAADA